GVVEARDRRGVRSPEDLRVGVTQRQLERRRADMWIQDVWVGVVDHGGFVRPAEDLRRMTDDVLVQGVVLCDEYHERALLRAPRTPRLLPRPGDGSGVARDDAGIEPADVDAELERGRCGDPEQRTIRQIAFEGPPFLGKVSRAVRRDAAGD